MKRLILLVAMAVLTIGATQAQSKATTAPAKEAKVEIQTNASRGCQKCADRFKENVPFFKGVKDYTYDAKTAVIVVKFDPNKTNADQIRQGISKMGYDADNVKADPAARAKLPECCRKGGTCAHGEGEHKCSHGEGEHKCQGAQNGEHKCQHAEGQQHQCQGAQNGEHKCQHAEGEHKCQGAQNGEHKCQHAEGEHKCQGAQNGEHKCQHAEGQQHQCQGAQNGEHKCNHQCQGGK